MKQGKSKLTPAERGRLGGLKSRGGGFTNNPELAKLANQRSHEAKRKKRAGEV